MISTQQQVLTETIPKDLIEQKVLEILNLEIRDLEDYTDEVIPLGQARYHVYRHGRFMGRIEDWGEKFYTKMAAGFSQGYPSLYLAATAWVFEEKLKQIESAAEQQLRAKREAMPDYF